ncbi:leucine-rich repeat domain-containing protein [Treponema sp. TIM-1]|uniref:leucine-rich repeat domain-containing protein n=1 Tax=Treponema sp. TIM-1 TaxID=2898417 RepID=UPI00397F038C
MKKNRGILFGSAVLVAAAICMAGCGKGGAVSSAKKLEARLAAASGGATWDDPVPAAYRGKETPAAVYAALENAGKYVSLDLSASSLTSFLTYDSDAKKLIVSLTLPDALTAIPAGDREGSAFTSLKTISAAKATTVGDYAFARCPLIDVSLPAATDIGGGAFSGCDALTSVSLPAATSIGESAFEECDALTGVNLPAATSIGEWAFEECDALTGVNLPAATSIGEWAFENIGNLADVYSGAGTYVRDNGNDETWKKQ